MGRGGVRCGARVARGRDGAGGDAGRAVGTGGGGAGGGVDRARRDRQRREPDAVRIGRAGTSSGGNRARLG
ncbi:hypothetical protein GCM10010428_34800 [Actinosynnema pretiosum subsp. pretiosum]